MFNKALYNCYIPICYPICTRRTSIPFDKCNPIGKLLYYTPMRNNLPNFTVLVDAIGVTGLKNLNQLMQLSFFAGIIMLNDRFRQ